MSGCAPKSSKHVRLLYQAAYLRARRRVIHARHFERREKVVVGQPRDRLQNQAVATLTFGERQKMNKTQRTKRIPVFVHVTTSDAAAKLPG